MPINVWHLSDVLSKHVCDDMHSMSKGMSDKLRLALSHEQSPLILSNVQRWDIFDFVAHEIIRRDDVALIDNQDEITVMNLCNRNGFPPSIDLSRSQMWVFLRLLLIEDEQEENSS